MADINQVISLGIGTPAGIPEFLTFGLQIGAEATINVSYTQFTLTANAAEINTPVPFEFPTVSGFNVDWILDPLDKIYFTTLDSETPISTWAKSGNTVSLNATPVQLDRYAIRPELQIESGDMAFKVSNRYGVKKYALSRVSGSWYEAGQIEVATATFTLTTYQATIA